MKKGLATSSFRAYLSLTLLSKSSFNFGLSEKTHIILRPSNTILLELSRYSSIRLKV